MPVVRDLLVFGAGVSLLTDLVVFGHFFLPSAIGNDEQRQQTATHKRGGAGGGGGGVTEQRLRTASVDQTSRLGIMLRPCAIKDRVFCRRHRDRKHLSHTQTHTHPLEINAANKVPLLDEELCNSTPLGNTYKYI